MQITRLPIRFFTFLAFYPLLQNMNAGELRGGDIIFHSSGSAQSRAIEAATHSPYSHVGLIFEENGGYWVYEAVEPVGKARLQDWIRHGRGGHYVIKRLKDTSALSKPEALAKLKAQIRPWLGKSYDAAFAWSDDEFYCSELVWKAYQRALGLELGPLQRLQEFDLHLPVVQAKLKERYGDKIPLAEKVISPAAIFASDLLETVEQR